MNYIEVTKDKDIATVTLNRGKVNAINEILVDQAKECFDKLKDDRETKSVILTGNGKFFSFGFDIPEFLSYSKDDFTRFLTKFTALYTDVFMFDRPVVAALNGHTVAAGCMLALSCDCRIMIPGKAKISLNEISFGASVFGGSVEMLRYCVGSKKASEILYSGAMYNADKAIKIGLIDKVTDEQNLIDEAKNIARNLANKDQKAFGSIKKLLRRPVVEEMIRREKDSIREFVDIWYSENTWKNIQKIKIHP